MPRTHPLDPLVSYLTRPMNSFALGAKEKAAGTASLPPGFRVIAHRAAPGRVPENSLTAVRRAVGIGVKDIEVDIRQTLDGRWVGAHDPDLNRVAKVNRRVADLTLAELRRIAVRGEPIATLEEFLDAVPAGVRLHLDFKGCVGPLPHAAASLLETIYARGACDRVSLTSLLHPALERLRALDSRIPLGYITLWHKLDVTLSKCLARHRPSHEPRRAIEAAAKLGASAIEPFALQPGLAAFAEAAHEAGLQVYAYTIDSASAAVQAASWGADGIFTNVPERFLTASA